MRDKILWAYGYFICISIVLIVFIGICFKTNDYHWMTQDRAYVLNDWQSSITGDEIIISDTYLAHAPINQEIYYWRQIPEEPLRDNRLIFYSVHQEVKVYIEDQLIYSHRKSENAFGKSPGNLWNIISIPRNSGGKRLTISLSSPYRQSAGVFQKVYYGDKYTIIQEIKETYAITLLIGYCILGVGIGIILIWNFLHRTKGKDRALLYLGLFATTFAIWSISESPLTVLDRKNLIWIAYANSSALIFLTLPILLFMREIYPQRTYWFWDGSCISCLVNIFGCIFLQVTNQADFRETVNIILSMIAIFFIGVICITVKEIKRDSLIKQNRLYCIGMLLVIVAVMVDIVCYRLNIQKQGAIYARSALLMMLTLMGIDGLRKGITMFELGESAEKYRSLAFNDQLTGLYNRRAMVAHLKWKYSCCNKVAIFMFDLNNLKECNDQKGHNIGDEYILESAKLLEQVIRFKGQCYRIGGDEFCYIVDNMNHIQCEALIQELLEKVDQFNQLPHDYKMEIAWGYAVYDAQYDADLNQTRDRADKMMYQVKKEIKKQNGTYRNKQKVELIDINHLQGD